MNELTSAVLEPVRHELTAYLCRMVLRPHLAEELAQTTFLRALENAHTLPPQVERARAWVFRVATNLAIDELRRHGPRRELPMQDLRELAESNPEFMALSRERVGTPETKAVAREHLVACFACTMKRLPERRAAALLLKEVHGFTVEEAASILDATPAQVKNWLQEARAEMTRAYDQTCALVTKAGVCHQCEELDGVMRSQQGPPLAPGCTGLEARLTVVRALARQRWGAWHHALFQLVDEMA